LSDLTPQNKQDEPSRRHRANHWRAPRPTRQHHPARRCSFSIPSGGTEVPAAVTLRTRSARTGALSSTSPTPIEQRRIVGNDPTILLTLPFLSHLLQQMKCSIVVVSCREGGNGVPSGAAFIDPDLSSTPHPRPDGEGRLSRDRWLDREIVRRHHFQGGHPRPSSAIACKERDPTKAGRPAR